ncbi:PepSY domain-containing protein [Caballeronia glebae]|uniref:PepSY domain-containing protein n=1 Tax=Caballeronia glebae TaxID=1777143 RepID=UPI0038BBDBC3
MKKEISISVAAVSLLATSIAAFGFTGDQYAREARISIAQARAAALKAHPGKIADEELEKEPGGSGLRYSFGIASSGGLQEVGVDAQSGAILENKAEGHNPD